ncbi:iron-containing redox enzyme family protein [beta proteobacterium MWH-UniP1]
MSDFFSQLQSATTKEREFLVSAPVIQDAVSGTLSREDYMAFLEQAYHHVKHTVPLLMATGSRLAPHQMWMQASIAEYIEEEIGHDEWILSDIAACGGDPDRVRKSIPSHATEIMVAYAYYQIERVNPVGFFGMVHVLEGTSVSLATRAAASIQSSLGLPGNAFSYLNSHGSLDIEHVQFFETLMNGVTNPQDQQQILHCAKRFYRLYGDIFRSLRRDEAVAV